MTISHKPGSPGYCKICDSRLLPAINKKLNDRVSLVDIVDWAGEFNEKFTRQTLAKHKQHVTDTRITFVENAKRHPAIRPSSNEEFLDAVRDAGFAKVVENPDSVTVAQALKAAQISMNAKKNGDKLTVVLVGVMTGKADEVIEGEWKEL